MNFNKWTANKPANYFYSVEGDAAQKVNEGHISLGCMACVNKGGQLFFS